MLNKNLEYYLSLPYTIEITPDIDDDGEKTFFARVLELPGCMTEAEDFTELGEMLHDAMSSWLEAAIEDGEDIPEPRLTEDYSGKFVVRVPKSLHKELVITAERDKVSLNNFVNTALAKAIGTLSSSPSASEISSNTAAPFWPRLSSAAWRAMIAAGLNEEAQIVNEQMFADWLRNHIQQIEAALDMAYIQDAIQHLEICQQAIRICAQNSDSPLMDAFHQVIKLLGNQVDQLIKLQAGSISSRTVYSKVRSQIQNRRQVYTSLASSNWPNDLTHFENEEYKWDIPSEYISR